MNKLDVTIVEILEAPKQVVNDDLCCWEVKVLLSTWGGRRERVLRATSKADIDRYKPGYSWDE